MARCGCGSGTCSCVIEGSGSITVTGSGTTSSPYEISGGGVLQVTDTSTVDLTLTGSGSVASPYQLSAVAQVSLDELTDVDVASATTGQVIAKQANGTWIGVPAPTAAPGILSVTGGIEGDGSAGAPLSVKLAPNSGLIEDSSGLRVQGETATGWVEYTVTPTGSIINPSMGNGWAEGRYRQTGKTVFVNVEIYIGTTTQRGSGYWGFNLPVEPYGVLRQVLTAHMGAVGTGDFTGTVPILGQNPTRIYFASGTKDIPLQGGWPYTFGAGSRVIISGVYEAA